MRFKEMMSISTLKENLRENLTRLSQVRDSASLEIKSIIEPLIELHINDFIKFFSPLGFQIKISDSVVHASYKQAYILLERLEPGRRKEDIPCLFRYRLLIHLENDDIYEIYVQTSDNIKIDESARSNKLSNAPMLIGNIVSLHQANCKIIHEVEHLQSNCVYPPHLSILEELKKSCYQIEESLEKILSQIYSLKNGFIRFILFKPSPAEKSSISPKTFTGFWDILQELDAYDIC